MTTFRATRPCGSYRVEVDPSTQCATVIHAGHMAAGTITARRVLATGPRWTAADSMTGAPIGEGFASASAAFRAVVDHHSAGRPALSTAEVPVALPKAVPTPVNAARIVVLVEQATEAARVHLAYNPSLANRIGIAVAWSGSCYAARVRTGSSQGTTTVAVLYG